MRSQATPICEAPPLLRGGRPLCELPRRSQLSALREGAAPRLSAGRTAAESGRRVRTSRKPDKGFAVKNEISVIAQFYYAI